MGVARDGPTMWGNTIAGPAGSSAVFASQSGRNDCPLGAGGLPINTNRRN